MKILYITQYYPPEIGAGPVRAESISKSLASSGHNVEVVCEFPNYPTGVIPENYQGKWFTTEKVEGVNVNRVKVIATRRNSRFQQLLQFGSFLVMSLVFCIKNMREYDVIYASSPPLSSALVASMLSKISGIKWIFEVRDLWPDSMLEGGNNSSDSLFYKFLKRLERNLYETASTTIAVTQASADEIRSLCPKADVRVIHNGVDPDIFLPKDNVQNPENRFIVGYIGSIGVIHDFEPVIRAAKLCEDDDEIEFLIVGDGSRREELEDLIKQYNPGNLNWIGLKPYHEVPEIMKTFALGLNPIRNVKPFEKIINVKFYEYLSCKVPVVSLGKGAIKKIGDESGSAITLQHGDYEGLARTVKELKASPHVLQTLQKNSRGFVDKTYNRRLLSAETEKMIREIVNKK